uniref:Uncharacterized protein n=1 Tax=Steinernema glaseri TaxID=37863 RepID=A0A1I8AFZ9_9BILA
MLFSVRSSSCTLAALFFFVVISANSVKEQHRKKIDEQLKKHKKELRSLNGVPVLEKIRDKIFEDVRQRLYGLLDEYEAMALAMTEEMAKELKQKLEREKPIIELQIREGIKKCVKERIARNPASAKDVDKITEYCKKLKLREYGEGINTEQDLEKKLVNDERKKAERSIRKTIEEAFKEDEKRIRQQIEFFKRDIKDIVINRGKEKLYEWWATIEQQTHRLARRVWHETKVFGESLNFGRDSFFRPPTYPATTYNLLAAIAVIILCTKCKRDREEKPPQDDHGVEIDHGSAEAPRMSRGGNLWTGRQILTEGGTSKWVPATKATSKHTGAARSNEMGSMWIDRRILTEGETSKRKEAGRSKKRKTKRQASKLMPVSTSTTSAEAPGSTWADGQILAEGGTSKWEETGRSKKRNTKSACRKLKSPRKSSDHSQ